MPAERAPAPLAGPVVIDVPKDVFSQQVEIEAWPTLAATEAPPKASESEIRAIAEAIAAAKRPILFVGGGIIAAEASAPLRDFCGLRPSRSGRC